MPKIAQKTVIMFEIQPLSVIKVYFQSRQEVQVCQFTTLRTKDFQTMRTLEGCSYFLKEAGYQILSLDLIETENAFYSLEELITWMMGTVTANWNIPLTQSRSFFTDLIQRMYELDSNLIDQEGSAL